MQAVEFHCAHVNTIKSPQMSAWFNFFHSVRQPNWISPKWLSISCLCDEWLSLPGISEPFSHLLNFQITFWAKCAATHFPKIKMNWKKKKLNENETNIQFIESDFKFGEVLFLLFLINCMWLCDRDRVLSLFLCVCVCVCKAVSTKKPYSLSKFWNCSQMRPWPCTSLSLALYSTAALSGRDSMTCFPVHHE